LDQIATELCPRVSVVMSVYNGERSLERAVQSVLSQEGVDFEFIIVNDGSTDKSGELLRKFAQDDHRVRFFEQENLGLTRALIVGCSRARGEFIARIDSDDCFKPGRLKRQAEFFEQHPNAALLSCGTRFVGPGREFLFDLAPDSKTLQEGLSALSLSRIQGPSSHSSVMFRTATYHVAGGYREEFRVAQDMDLWLRLVEHGEAHTIPDILVEVQVSPDSISGTGRRLQMTLGRTLIACARCRKVGSDESKLLKEARELSKTVPKNPRRTAAQTNYFLGRMLHKNRDSRCLPYLQKASFLSRSNPRYLVLQLLARLHFIAGWYNHPDTQIESHRI
jgi:glycosyltransferase involved in cell wall biosynthesis